MKYLVGKDRRNRSRYVAQERRYLASRVFMRDAFLIRRFKEKEVVSSFITRSFLKASKRSGYVRNRCFLTGRGRAVVLPFRLSRMKFKEVAGRGWLYGVRKSSW